ncbi:MAG: anaerobic ribonucleoside-triphosphate reductase [Methanophagales archaeon]|nr:anaerobic ribonucleoside-triphosphate reductase [Methanophagales archaeon]MCW3141293.1 anaerobic ribonucleoside-triphosphate reductase [Methanophagales archaeon]
MSGMGRGGRGQGIGRGGQGHGRGGGSRLGPGGECRCPNCGYTMAHQAGVPCYQQTCPKCGSKMTRP